MKTLLFVDTNILLDFYRVRDKIRLEFLSKLESVAADVIFSYVDDYHVQKIETDADPIEISISFHATGDQMDDKMYCGTEIEGSAVALIDRDGTVEFTDVSAALKDDFSGPED